jgi:hypothetical protein
MTGIDSRLIFVGGLHRSGTTPLARILGQHPEVSTLSGTGVFEDEGQHLQSVYPPALHYGGSGHFARSPEAHLTETSPLVGTEQAKALVHSWTPYWDLSRPRLVEKSPPNMLMGRFLQALFPAASFVMVVRHPVVVALSTRKWTHFISRHPRKFANLSSLVGHWMIAHRLLAADFPYLRRVHVVYYEDLIQHPGATLESLRKFLDLGGAIPGDLVKTDRSSPYARQWDKLSNLRRPGGWQRRWIESRYGDDMAEFGYDVTDLNHHVSPVPKLSQC